MKRIAHFHVFTPQRDNPDELEQIFVQRHELLSNSIDKIRESVLTRNKHHLLFIGPRGMGKSHIVTLIHHRLSSQNDVIQKGRFAWLNEDQTSTSFLHLLARVFRKLSEQYPEEFDSTALESLKGKDQSTARSILEKTLIRSLNDKTIILLVENIDGIFRNLNEIEQRTWRAFVQNNSVITTIATAQGLTDEISKQDKPFFGFFDTTHLKALTVSDATELLRKIAVLNNQDDLANYLDTPKGKSRLRAIHHLSGGNPRLYLILSDFLTKESLDNLVQIFEETVDRQLTPYFQERMRWLSAQQQEIVQFLCQRVHPSSVKEISESIFATPGSVSSQLKQLRENGYLISKQRGKESLYELAEPLMRLSFQVKESNGRQPLTLIVDFLRVWYDREEIEKRIAGFSETQQCRKYFEVALHKIEIEGKSFRHSLMRAELENVDFENCESGTIETLLVLAEETEDVIDWDNYAQACFHNADFDQAIEALGKIIESPKATDSSIATALRNRGMLYGLRHEINSAISDYENCIKILPSGEARHEIVMALATLYQESDKFDLSLSLYNEIISIPDVSLGHKGNALFNRAILLSKKGNISKALKDYSALLKLPDLAPDVYKMSRINRGNLFGKRRRFTEAIYDFTIVIDQKDTNEDLLSKALLNRADILAKTEGMEIALEDYRTIIAFENCPPNQRASALIKRAEICFLKSDKNLSISDLDAAIAMGSEIDKSLLTRAHFTRASSLFAIDHKEKAVQDLYWIVENDNEDRFSYSAWVLICSISSSLNRHQEALDSLLHFLSFPKQLVPIPQLGQLVGNTLVNSTFDLVVRNVNHIDKVKQILTKLDDSSILTEFGGSLVAHLKTLSTSNLNQNGIDQWVSYWETLGSGYQELEIPLRILRAGGEQIKTGDNSSLLSLVKEERAIAISALGIKFSDN